jgi:hypothetical protein
MFFIKLFGALILGGILGEELRKTNTEDRLHGKVFGFIPYDLRTLNISGLTAIISRLRKYL